jgi:hypothetical protein
VTGLLGLAVLGAARTADLAVAEPAAAGLPPRPTAG